MHSYIRTYICSSLSIYSRTYLSTYCFLHCFNCCPCCRDILFDYSNVAPRNAQINGSNETGTYEYVTRTLFLSRLRPERSRYDAVGMRGESRGRNKKRRRRRRYFPVTHYVYACHSLCICLSLTRRGRRGLRGRCACLERDM